MNFKPFYIRYDESMSDQDVADVFDKAVSKGTYLLEGVEGLQDHTDAYLPSDYILFGVDNEGDTLFGDSNDNYGYGAVELTLDQVDAHLGINIEEVSTLVPHIHAKEIKAWADGYEIEVFRTVSYRGEGWFNSKNPDWNRCAMYRIKPTEEELDLADELKDLDDRRKKVLHKLEELQKG